MGWECSVCRTAAAGLPTPGYTHDPGCLRAPGPSELARRIAHAVVCAVIPSGWVVPAIKHEAAVAADRELAKVHAIPAETLDQVEKAFEHLRMCGSCAEDNWNGCDGGREVEAAIEALRAARSEKSR